MNNQIYSEMYILGCILNNFDDTDFIIETLEDFVQGKGQFPGLRGIPADYLLNELKVHLINADFVGVSLTNKGVQALCLEWVEKRKKGQYTEEPIDENIFKKHGLEAFIYLEKKFPKKKAGPEWYSAIYRFLFNKYLVSGVEEYKDFVLSSGRLESFSKVTLTCTTDGKLNESNIYIDTLKKHYERFLKLKGLT